MHHPYASMLPRLAEYARRHPRLYRLRVGGLALLGYVVMIVPAVAGLAVITWWAWDALGGGAIAMKVAVPLLVIAGIVMLQAAVFRVEAPHGMVLDPATAPALFADLERLRTQLRAPTVHQVLLTAEVNAGVISVPRLGVFGLHRTYLSIGFPLLASFSHQEFRALLAHEYGHVSGNDSRFRLRILRAYDMWTQALDNELLQKMAESHWAYRAIGRFGMWYTAIMDVYGAVLRRETEFAADRAAARAVGAQAVAATLARTPVAARFLDDVFWDGVYAGARESPRTPDGVFLRMLDEAPAAAAHPSAASWLQDALAQHTEPWDSHPAISERLAALSRAPAVPAPVERSAAAAYLGDHARPIADQISREWAEALQPVWSELHARGGSPGAVRTASLEPAAVGGGIAIAGA